jgi:hypothetical protein
MTVEPMHKLYIEKVTKGNNGFFLCSELIPATEEDIKNFKNRPCEHSLHEDKLIYDEPGWPYDFRYCGICGAFLGMI